MVVVNFDNLRAVYQQARIGQAFDEATSHAELLNDEARGINAIVINFTKSVFGLVNDIHADKLKVKFVKFANFDNIVNTDKFVAAVNNHTNITEFPDVSDPNERGMVNEERAVNDVGHDLEIGRIDKWSCGLGQLRTSLQPHYGRTDKS